MVRKLTELKNFFFRFLLCRSIMLIYFYYDHNYWSQNSELLMYWLSCSCDYLDKQRSGTSFTLCIYFTLSPLFTFSSILFNLLTLYSILFPVSVFLLPWLTGNAVLFNNDPRVITFSMHCVQNYFSEKQHSDIDVELQAGTEDMEYLAKLQSWYVLSCYDGTYPALTSSLAFDYIYLPLHKCVLMYVHLSGCHIWQTLLSRISYSSRPVSILTKVCHFIGFWRWKDSWTLTSVTFPTRC